MLAMVVWIGAGLASAPIAAACSLVPIVADDKVTAAKLKLSSADIAIYGVVSSVRILKPPAAQTLPTIGERFEARIRVTRVFKGITTRILRVRGDTNGASCGIGELRVREHLGLRLNRPSRPYRVGLSSRITLLELLRATDGKWRRPL